MRDAARNVRVCAGCRRIRKLGRGLYSLFRYSLDRLLSGITGIASVLVLSVMKGYQAMVDESNGDVTPVAQPQKRSGRRWRGEHLGTFVA